MDARVEAKDIQAVIDEQKGGFQLQPWDWEFYSEQVRKAKYDLDESAVKPYFEINSVLENGVFYAANQLYGITFHERHDITVYQPDVRVFEVRDADDKPLALFFCDYFKRDNEHWALYPTVFAHYARHYKTGEPMPAELVEKIKKSKGFNQGYEFTELLAAAELDMQWHTLPESAPLGDVKPLV